jgi:hypothetical protein
MPQRDIHNTVKTAVALDIQTISTNTTTAGNIIDTQGYEGVEFILLSDTITDGVYTPSIVAGDNSSLTDGVAVPIQYLIGTTKVIDTLASQRPSYDSPSVAAIADATFSLAADSNKSKRIGTVTPYRYVRLNIASTGTSSGGALGAIALLGWSHVNPTPKD